MQKNRVIDRIDCLFPDGVEIKKSADEIDKIINNRISKHVVLNEKEKQQLLVFINKVMNHKDYKRIKPTLSKLQFKDYELYRDIIMQVLDDVNYTNKVPEFITSLVTIIRLPYQLITKLIKININNDLVQDYESDILYAINFQGYDLLNDKDNSIYLEILTEKFDESTKWVKSDEYLKKVQERIRPTLYETCLKKYRETIYSYNTVKEKKKELETNLYVIDSQSKFFKRLRGGMISCSHPK